jgi:hypothetical protein
MRLRNKIAAGVVVGVTAVGAAGAYAYWTQEGTGTGTAALGTTSAITVVQTTAITGLYPGGPALALSGNFNNTNAAAVTISGVTAVVQPFSSRTDATKPACTEADFTIAGTAAGSTVPPGAGVGAWSGLTVQMRNTATNQDNCKTQSITIVYTAAP